MTKLAQVLDKIVAAIGTILGWLLIVMILLILYEVVMRYIFRNPPIIADEFSRYMLVTMAFLGLAYCWRGKGHVRVTSFVIMMPSRVATWLRLTTLLMALAMGIILTWSSYYFLQNTFQFNTLSNSWLRVPLKWPQLTVGIGYFLLIPWLIYEIAKVVDAIRQGKTVEENLK